MKPKSILWFGVSTGIIALMVYLADFNQVLGYFASANKSLLGLAILFGLLPIAIWAYSWHHFINNVGMNLSFSESFRLFTSGNFLNAITPLGQFGGEPFMAYVLKDNTDLNYEKSLSAVLSADIVNAIPIVTFIVIGSFIMFFSRSLTGFVIDVLAATIIILVVGGLTVFVLWFRFKFVEVKITKLMDFLSERFKIADKLYDGVVGRLSEFESAFSTVGDERNQLLKVIFVSHFYFLFQGITLYLLIRSFGADTNFLLVYFILPAASLANFSPTPGGSGAYEAVLAGILSSIIGIGGSLSVAIAIMYRFTTFWPSLVVGYISFVSLPGFEFGEIKDELENP